MLDLFDKCNKQRLIIERIENQLPSLIKARHNSEKIVFKNPIAYLIYI